MSPIRVYCLRLLLVLCMGISGSARAAGYLSDFVVGGAVDTYTYAPKDQKSIFLDEVDEIWATAFINNAPEGSLVEADWFQNRQGQFQKILGTRLEAGGSRYFASRMQPSEGGKLPVGKYLVVFKFNGEQQGSVEFSIIHAAEKSGSVSTFNGAGCDFPREGPDALVELVGSRELVDELNFGRYTDPEQRFSVVVPGAWFPGETGDPNEALFLSQNMENDPIAWIVIHAYKSHLTPKFDAADTVNQLRGMLLEEGAKRGAREYETESDGTVALSESVAIGSLIVVYQSDQGKDIGQLHRLVVDGRHAFNLQVTVEADLSDLGNRLIDIVGRSFWTVPISEVLQSQAPAS